jgi:glutaredoxin
MRIARRECAHTNNKKIMEEEKKESKVAESKMEECCATGKCICEKYKKFLPQIIGVALLIIIASALGYYELVWKKGNISPEEAKVQVEDFINNNLMQEGTKAEIGEVVKEEGLYKVTVKIGEGAQAQEIQSYLTLDGKKFFPSAPMDIEETKAQIAEAKEKENAPEEIPTSAKPTVDLYVMSFCPYGNKAEDTIQPVYELLKDKVDFNFHYIVSSSGDTINSLHGQPEVVQNEREACVLKYFGKDKWMGFVTYVNTNCGSDGACWEAGIGSVGLSSTKIAACVKAEGVALMKAEEKKSSEAGASGSPTMLVNGVSTKSVYKYSDSEAYKQTICSAFETVPAECEKTLDSATTTAEGGSCN